MGERASNVLPPACAYGNRGVTFRARNWSDQCSPSRWSFPGHQVL